MRQPQPAPERAQTGKFRTVEALELSPADPTGPRFRIEDIYPTVDGGRYGVKRVSGEAVGVWADIFREGHDVISAAIVWRRDDRAEWHRAPMQFVNNDRWHGEFTPAEPGCYLFAIEAWTDYYATWRKEFLLKQQAGQNVLLDAREGVALAAELMPESADARAIVTTACREVQLGSNTQALLEDDVASALATSDIRPDLTRSAVIPLTIDPPIARASAWYEMIPRSQSAVAGKHGTFEDCIARIPDIADQGFDVIYFTPIHPIGTTNRKGRNNALNAKADDPGSPYAIGGREGGHDAVHPELGTLDDFRRFVRACGTRGIQVALDFAIQCSPDHPWLKQHPEWFKRRADGSIRFAENPPKKYEDIVNPDFYSDDRISLWEALRDVVLFWVEQGVHIFRVDNPHTKPFPFWEWLIHEVRTREPRAIFLSEAFTRPKVMKALAKIGFTQSYTYFTWRTTKPELQEYLGELTGYPENEYFRPNFFVTTPDILPVQLQTGETWLFKARFALAATLSSNYGIYNGFELIEHEPIPGKEEYLDSEKYTIKTRDWNNPGNIKPYIAQVNRIRRDNSALLQTNDLRFAVIDDPGVIGFVKESVNRDNAVAVAIALTPDAKEFWFHFGDMQIGPEGARLPVRSIENLVTGEHHLLEWSGVRLRIYPSNDPMLLFRCHT